MSHAPDRSQRLSWFSPVTRQQIVLLGIGHTNAHLVKQWADSSIDNCDLVCVSQFAESTYSGMLPGTLGGQFSDQAMRIDLRALVESVGARLVIDETVGLDTESRQLHLSKLEGLRYDVLAIGVGSMPKGHQQFSGQPHVVPIKPMQTFLTRLDRARNNYANSGEATICVVGGGVAGVEISLCLRQHLQRANVRSKICIVSSGDRIAGGLCKRSLRRLEKLLRQRSIDVVTGQSVVGVDRHGLDTRSGEHIASDVVIWATGAEPPSVLSRLGLQTDADGFIATLPTLQAVSDRRVFAVGDCGTIIDHPCPKAGVYAVRQGPVLWSNVRAVLNDEPLTEFRPQQGFLKLLNTGDDRALLDYGQFSVHARWCLTLKNYIDRSFVQDYQVNT
ncbi:FAD-dependent oxidoreductase [Roseiconus lacunae]|uniref:FAD-dependent oxidoreductase n=1 Tax=Roseiconus lacunae TaxID=2605694 RepID=UPI001F1960D0|nr:FAD-dependent oxidoreductase [Roseiconus lacunae]